MKKTLLLLTLIVCAAVAFSQEAVGRLIVKEPYLEIEVDFYENNVPIETVLKIIETRLITTQAKGLRSVDGELYDSLIEELQKRILSVKLQQQNIIWGYSTEFLLLKFSFSYQKKDYFVIAIIPEENYWIFEQIKK